MLKEKKRCYAVRTIAFSLRLLVAGRIKCVFFFLKNYFKSLLIFNYIDIIENQKRFEIVFEKKTHLICDI